MDKKPTIGEVLREASPFFTDPFEAELLMRKLLQMDRTTFYLSLNKSFPKHKINTWQTWVQRRQAQEPIQYIVQEQEFYGRTFLVNPSVLIPRPETEILVEKVLEETDRLWPNQRLHIVDLGTGSGAISISLAMERPKWKVTAIDYSEKALEVAFQNAQYHHVSDRIRMVLGDFLMPLIEANEMIDVIVANPPYISISELEQLEAQVRDFEPKLALNGGEDGLQAYRHIVSQLKEIQLPKKYLLAFEIGATQAQDVETLLQSFDDSLQISVYPDLANRDRVIIARHV